MPKKANVTNESRRWFGVLPLFDPAKGRTVLEPPGKQPGSWAGGASVTYDEQAGRFYLLYRLRNPRKPGDPKERGYECRMAESKDGVRFKDIWAATKEDLGAISIERGSIIQTLEGRYRLYLSYEDLKLGRWKIDMLEAAKPGEFDVASRRTVFLPIDRVVAHVKDPYVILVGRLYFMYISYHPIRWQSSNTGLALSGDGVEFVWQGDVFAHGKGWDTGVARISSIVHVPPMFYAFYDGAENMKASCEENASLAISFDLRRFERVSESGPLFRSPHGAGSLRYVDALKLGDEMLYYYEWTRPDGAHELRMNRVSLRS